MMAVVSTLTAHLGAMCVWLVVAIPDRWVSSGYSGFSPPLKTTHIEKAFRNKYLAGNCSCISKFVTTFAGLGGG
ncbi:hypothetical protein DPMN_006734 [Dreissena polymorpha]|uniref:Secreted protein n=1 Tax=Dreissena polymorpha TaxID=45954 RepID=A0A9D4MW04_DREPO|nr:hypothetical protein DPMN_006734 [Dreissena polymorpha]